MTGIRSLVCKMLESFTVFFSNVKSCWHFELYSQWWPIHSLDFLHSKHLISKQLFPAAHSRETLACSKTNQCNSMLTFFFFFYFSSAQQIAILPFAFNTPCLITNTDSNTASSRNVFPDNLQSYWNSKAIKSILISHQQPWLIWSVFHLPRWWPDCDCCTLSKQSLEHH